MSHSAPGAAVASPGLPGWRQRLPKERVAAQERFLRQRLQRLYGEASDFEAWFDALLDAVAQRHEARPAALLALDAQRVANPGWFQSQSQLGYSAYVDRFGGTLCGIAPRIPHLRELGVSYLHLLPFLKARRGESDGGFAVSSFEHIEPSLGNMVDLEVLTTQLRAAGISLCSDLVLNHVADDHPWALAAKAGDRHYRNYFYCFADRSEPDAYEATLGEVFPSAAPGNFTWVPELKAWVWSTFYPYQWDLNYRNPQVFAEMALALLGLANRGVEAFRLDSAGYLWKQLGSPCMNQPEAHWILQALRSIVELAAPGVLLKAEAIVPTQQLPPYFGAHEPDAQGRECHLAYQSSFMAASWVAVAEQNTELLRGVVDDTPALPQPASWLSYVRCHDDIGWNVLRRDAGKSHLEADARLAAVSHFFAGDVAGSFASGEAFQTDASGGAHGSNGMAAALLGLERATTPQAQSDALKRLALLYGLALCVGGMPLLYMGDEFGQCNDYSAARAAARAIDSRWLQRPYFSEALFAQRHDAGSVSGRCYAQLCNWLRLRRQLPQLAANIPARWHAAGHLAALGLRRGEQFLAAGNFSGQIIDFQLPERPSAKLWQDCDSNERVQGQSLRLSGWQMRWLVAV